MVPLALACNIVVAGQGVLAFQSKGLIRWRFAAPFLAASVPCAFLGGAWRLKPGHWHLLLGAGLLLSGCSLLWTGRTDGRGFASVPAIRAWRWGLPLGAALGCFSGLVGIGGGIFLAPLLHHLRLGTAREIAALSSLFILLNSASGLLGQSTRYGPDLIRWEHGLLVAAVLAGGMSGSRLAAGILPHATLRRWTAVLVLAAAIRILLSTPSA